MIQTLFAVLSLVCLVYQGFAINITLESNGHTYAKGLLLLDNIAGNGVLAAETNAGNLRLIAADTNSVILSRFPLASFTFTAPPYVLTAPPTREKTLTGFNRPRGIWVVGGGVYCIADTLNFVVKQYTRSTDTLITLAGQSGVNGNSGDGLAPTVATMWSPFAGDYHSSSNTHYLVDLHRCIVRTIDVTNNVINTFYGQFRQCQNGIGCLNKPTGIIATANNLFVTEKDSNRIVQINRVTKARTVLIGGTGAAVILRPVCLFRKDNVLYFCERDKIRTLTPLTNALGTVGPLSLGHTRGMFITDDYVVIGDSLRQNIVLANFPPVF